MRHYVYKLTENKTNEFYYGVRTCKCNPIDDNYMGSMAVWKPNRDNLVKEILFEFETREKAAEFESKIIEENIKNPLNRNYFIPTKEVGFYGYSHSTETKQKVSNTMSGRHAGENNPFYGKKHSKTSLNKIKESLLGKTHSDGTKKKMSESAKSIDRSNYNLKRRKVEHIPTGKIFNSIYEASKSLGVSRGKIHSHIVGSVNGVDIQFKLL